MKKSNLEVKILAINTLNEYAKKCFEYEKEHFSQFIGKNIFKVDGSIKQKFEHEKLYFKGNLPDGTFFDVHYWFTSSYSFDICIKICVNGGSWDVHPHTAFCQYETDKLELFALTKEKELKESTREGSNFTQYNIDDIIKGAKIIEEAKQNYEKALEHVPYIFRDVLYIKRIY